MVPASRQPIECECLFIDGPLDGEIIYCSGYNYEVCGLQDEDFKYLISIGYDDSPYIKYSDYEYIRFVFWNCHFMIFSEISVEDALKRLVTGYHEYIRSKRDALERQVFERK